MKEYFRELFSIRGRVNRVNFLLQKILLILIIGIGLVIFLLLWWFLHLQTLFSWSIQHYLGEFTTILSQLIFISAIIALFLATIAIVMANLSLEIKRLHDMNMSGWWMLLSFIPIINFLFLVAIWLFPWTNGINKYGPIQSPEKTRNTSQIILTLLNFIFGSIIFALTAIAIFKPDWIELFIAWMEKQVGLLGAWNYVIAFTSSIVESFPVIGVLIPGQQIMLLVGGFFGKTNLLPLILIAILGAIIGNASGYFLGKWYGESFFERYGDWFGLGKTELKYLKKQIEKNGAWFIILGKFHNFTRAFIPFIAGSMGMHTGRFWVYNIIGSIIWATTIIVLGVAFVTYYKVILSYISYVLMGILALTVGYIALFKREEFKKYLKEKEAEINEKNKK